MRLQIEKAVYGGAGLAHQTEGEGAGKAIFVPFTLPGEIVEARLLEQKNAFGEASLLQVLIASEDRVTPRCAPGQFDVRHAPGAWRTVTVPLWERPAVARLA